MEYTQRDSNMKKPYHPADDKKDPHSLSVLTAVYISRPRHVPPQKPLPFVDEHISGATDGSDKAR